MVKDVSTVVLAGSLRQCQEMTMSRNMSSQGYSDDAFEPHPEHADTVSHAIRAIRKLLLEQPAFEDVLRSASSTEELRKELDQYGIEISVEALWRHRGSFLEDGQPTWRG
jgi:hypothetical protein